MLVAVFLLAVVAASSTACQAPSPTSAPAEISQGWIGPLTGGCCAIRRRDQARTDLAVEEINASGKLGKPLRIIYEDDQAKPTAGVAAFEKLTKVNNVSVVIQAAASSVMLAVMPKAEAAKVVYISPRVPATRFGRKDAQQLQIHIPNLAVRRIIKPKC